MKLVLKRNLGLMKTCLWRKIFVVHRIRDPRVRISRSCIRRNLPANLKNSDPCGSVIGRFHNTLLLYDERWDSTRLWKEGIMWTIGTAWPLKTGTIGCSETSVNNYHYTLSKIPKERRRHENYNYAYMCDIFIYFQRMRVDWSVW